MAMDVSLSRQGHEQRPGANETFHVGVESMMLPGIIQACLIRGDLELVGHNWVLRADGDCSCQFGGAGFQQLRMSVHQEHAKDGPAG